MTAKCSINFSSQLLSVVARTHAKGKFFPYHLHKKEERFLIIKFCSLHIGSDSGGPMFVQEGDVQTQIGVISWGLGCGQPKKPGVYASVAHHHDFIMDVVCEKLGSEEICKDHPSYVSAPSSHPSEARSEPPSETPSASPSRSLVPSDLPSMTPSFEPSSQPEHEADSLETSDEAGEETTKSSSGVRTRPLSTAESCGGICYNSSPPIMKNPFQIVSLPNGNRQPCYIIDFVLKMQTQKADTNFCSIQAEEAQNAGCQCS